MKKLLQILLLSLGLIGCASQSIKMISPSDIESDRIIALGLTHEQNIGEARKLTDSDLVSAVIQELTNRIEQGDNAIVEEENATVYAENVIITDNSDSQIQFIGPEIKERKKGVLLVDSDFQNFYLAGLKTKNNGLIEHQLHLSLKYSADNWRNYNTASFCDKWQGCGDEEQVNITLISSKASGCNSSSCNYNEIMELSLSDDFLRRNIDSGFSVQFNSKGSSANKITISSAYIKGYLKIAN